MRIQTHSHAAQDNLIATLSAAMSKRRQVIKEDDDDKGDWK